MISGEQTSQQRIANRSYILKSLEYIISESVYYRTYSHLMIPEKKIASFDINLQENKAKI